MATAKKKYGPDAWDTGKLGRDERYVVVMDETHEAALRKALGRARSPNAETAAAMRETRSMVKARFGSAKALFDNLDHFSKHDDARKRTR